MRTEENRVRDPNDCEMSSASLTLSRKYAWDTARAGKQNLYVDVLWSSGQMKNGAMV
jgi:hypothetical protein